MTAKQKENLSKFKELGINIMKLTYDECVEILIDKYVEAFTACEYSEEDRFRKELQRIKNPTN